MRTYVVDLAKNRLMLKVSFVYIVASAKYLLRESNVSAELGPISNTANIITSVIRKLFIRV